MEVVPLFCKDWLQCCWAPHLSELPSCCTCTVCQPSAKWAILPLPPTCFWFLNELHLMRDLQWCVGFNSMFPPLSWRCKTKRCFGCIGAEGTWSTLPCKDTFVANVTFNTKWQLNARFGFPTAIKCLDYSFIFERFHGIKYNKLSKVKEQEMRRKRSCWNIFRHDISLCR